MLRWSGLVFLGLSALEDALSMDLPCHMPLPSLLHRQLQVAVEVVEGCPNPALSFKNKTFLQQKSTKEDKTCYSLPIICPSSSCDH